MIVKKISTDSGTIGSGKKNQENSQVNFSVKMIWRVKGFIETELRWTDTKVQGYLLSWVTEQTSEIHLQCINFCVAALAACSCSALWCCRYSCVCTTWARLNKRRVRRAVVERRQLSSAPRVRDTTVAVAAAGSRLSLRNTASYRTREYRLPLVPWWHRARQTSTLKKNSRNSIFR